MKEATPAFHFKRRYRVYIQQVEVKGSCYSYLVAGFSQSDDGLVLASLDGFEHLM